MREEIEEIVRAVGVERALNARHEVAKAHGWKEHPPSAAVFVDAALRENNLLRRPIFLREGRAVVGLDPDGLASLLG